MIPLGVIRKQKLVSQMHYRSAAKAKKIDCSRQWQNQYPDTMSEFPCTNPMRKACTATQVSAEDHAISVVAKT